MAKCVISLEDTENGGFTASYDLDRDNTVKNQDLNPRRLTPAQRAAVGLLEIISETKRKIEETMHAAEGANNGNEEA